MFYLILPSPGRYTSKRKRFLDIKRPFSAESNNGIHVRPIGLFVKIGPLSKPSSENEQEIHPPVGVETKDSAKSAQ